MSSAHDWRSHDPRSRWMVDLAANRAIDLAAPIELEDLELAVRHGLLGLMAGSGNSRLVEAAVLPFRRLQIRQQVMLAHLHRLLESLDRASIPVAVLKGPAVASMYRRPELRTFTDIDLLVPRSELEGCLEVLKRDPALQYLPPQRPRADKRDLVLVDGPSGLRFAVDLHWDAFSYSQLQGGTAGATEDAWSRATPIADDLGPRYLLPVEAEIAFLCAHAVLDHRFRLILFRDLLELALRPVDWSALEDFATRFRLRSTTYLALLIAARALDTPIPTDFLTQLRPGGVVLRWAERLLSRSDLVTFDGHRPHLLNLALVLLHDDWSRRTRLIIRAPFALPAWSRRVRAGRPLPANQDGRAGRRSITVLVTNTQRRGAEVFGERLVAGLVRRGWRAKLVAMTKAPEGAAAIQAPALSSKAPRELGRLDPATVLSLRRHIRSSEPEILLALGSSTLQYSVAATRLMRSRPHLIYASIGEPLFWARKLRQRLAYRILLRMADLVLAVSARTADQLAESLGVPRDRLCIVHTGVPGDLLEIRRTPQDGCLHILFLGSLAQEKNPLDAYEAFQRAAESIPARLRFVGAGPLRQVIEERVEEARLDGSVDLIGPVADVIPHLAWADVLLLTSRTEGLPAAVLEAAAAGVATVAYDVGGVAETVIDGVTGRLVELDDVDGLVAALRFYGTDLDACRRAGEAGREMVESRFTLDKSVERFDEVLSGVIDDRR